jgi:hypothetical protein
MAASVEPVDNYRCAAFAGGKVLVMEGGDVEPRVSALEGEMREMRARLNLSEQDAAAARVLAGAADRDVGEIRAEMRDFRRATVSSFNAVREDLVDLRGEVGELRAEVRSGFAAMRSGFDLTATGQQQIAGMLQTLIDREDRQK